MYLMLLLIAGALGGPVGFCVVLILLIAYRDSEPFGPPPPRPAPPEPPRSDGPDFNIPGAM